jgi:hypothetical protein
MWGHLEEDRLLVPEEWSWIVAWQALVNIAGC